jgi:spore germination protein YaaH
MRTADVHGQPRDARDRRGARRIVATLACSSVIVIACAALAIPGAAVARPSTGAPVRGCASQRVRNLRVVRLHGTLARLSWRAPSGAGAGTQYLVRRKGRTVGQTSADALALRAVPGRMTIYTVAVRREGAGSRCVTTLKAAIPFHPPGRISGLRVLRYTSDGVVVAWHSARRGDAPVIGYRLERDGAVVGQSSLRQRTVGLSPGHVHRLRVLAVDSRGHLGPVSASLSVSLAGRRGLATPERATVVHGVPTSPDELAAESVGDSSATLAWSAGGASGAHVTGYQLFKDSRLVGVVHGQRTTVALASERSYEFAVATVDSTGAVSQPSKSLLVVTTHTPPSTPASLTASAVGSGSVTLNWSPSTPVSGAVVGYRVFRNGVPLGQTAETGMALEGLAPSTNYTFTVVAVDSLGAISAPSEPTTVQTAAPPPTHGDVQAFLLASTDQSFHDLEDHYQQVGVVYPTYFECGAGGTVTGRDDPLVTGWAAARKIAVMPRLNCQNVHDEEQILNEPATRQAMIERLAALCQEDGYEGVQVDFEGAPPAERNPFTAFITLLAERLHAQGDKLSTIVTAKYFNVLTGRAAMYDDAALSVPSDYLFVLDWGLHWTTSAPGSIDEYGWFKKVAEYTATMPHRGKFVLGMPMYGLDWADGGGLAHPATALEYAGVSALAAQQGIEPQWDPVAVSPHFSYRDAEGAQHEVWYTDTRSIGARADLARSLGLGVGLWRLGEEDQGIWARPALGGGT